MKMVIFSLSKIKMLYTKVDEYVTTAPFYIPQPRPLYE